MESIVIAKYNRDRAAIAWVARAQSSDPTRTLLCCIHVEDAPEAPESKELSRVTATDNKRLHQATIDRLPAGNYTVENVAKGGIILLPAECGPLPDWRRVMPEKAAKPTRIDMSSPAKGKALGHSYHTIVTVTGAALDMDFLKDLLGHTWDLSFTESNQALRFDLDTMTAVIMPLALDPRPLR